MYCFAKFCRLCLEKSDRLLDYQTKDADNISLINKINTLMPSLIISNKNFPTLICDKCQVQLNNSYKFFKDCFKTNQRLVKYNFQLNFNGDKVNRELKVILDKLEGVEYNLSGIKKEGDEEYVLNLNDDTLNIKKIDLKINKEEIEAEIINPEKVEVVEDLLLNKIDGEVLANKIDDEVLANKIDGEVLANKTDDEVLANKIDGEVLANKTDDEVLANKIDGEVLANKRDDELLANKINDGGDVKIDVVLIKTEKHEAEDALNEEDEEGLTLSEEDEEETSNFDKTDPLLLTTSSKMKKKYVCKNCGKSFAHKSGLKCHFQNIHLKIRYNCKFCGKVFTQLSSLYYHERVIHFDIKKYKCDYCGKKFPAPKLLKRHLKTCKSRKKTETNDDEGLNDREDPLQQFNSEKTASDKKKHVCKSCGKSFSLLQNLERHFKNIHLKIRYSCKICNKVYTQLSSLEYHERVFHLGIRKHKCKYCERSFAAPKLLKCHLKRCKYRDETENDDDLWCNSDKTSNNGEGNVKMNFVLIKTEKYEAENEKDEAENEKDEEGPKLNEKNEQETSNFQEIIEPSTSAPSIPNNNCETCGKTFSSKANLKRHVESIHLKIRHNCLVCDKSFTDVNSLNYHQRSHLNIRKEKCDYCSREFPTPRHLKKHSKFCIFKLKQNINEETQKIPDKLEEIDKFELKTEEVDIE